MNRTVTVTRIPEGGKTNVCGCVGKLARASAVLVRAPVKIAINAEGKQEEATKEILKPLGVA